MQSGQGSRTLHRAQRVLAAADSLFERLLATTRARTEQGRRIDSEQALTERVAYLATQSRAAQELVAYAERAAAAGSGRELLDRIVLAAAAGVLHELRGTLDAQPEAFGLDDGAVATVDAEVLAAMRAGMRPELLAEIGRATIEAGGANNAWLEDEALLLARASVRAFTRSEVAPLAERMHRDDDTVPESLIARMAEMGFFAASIPEAYGGAGLGYPAMVITTEELSAGSLVAGSLSTRPEILARALMAGGTEAQRRFWLPRIASGELMVAIAVTEPDAGSDVAALTCRAEPAARDGRRGYLINGTKAWSTFAGRAEIIALLARTNPDLEVGSRGLSLFIVEKQPHRGHDFDEQQAGGGRLGGRAIRTPGYRGMHSYVLSFDDWFVPAENLVGEEGGRDRGFYLQLTGFAAGRLQTGGRAVGLAQAALERTCDYVSARRQFGRVIGEYQLTQVTIGRMAVAIAAARQLTYAAARAMEDAERVGTESERRSADLPAAMAKLLASDVAVRVTQEGQILHGGWGYAEETPISRYVVDAQVLPIFEGVKPVLELRVIGAALLRGS